MLYRTENAYGDGYRDIIEVMAYEIFTLGNADILETLILTIEQSNTELFEEMSDFKEQLEDNGFVDDMSEDDEIDFCERVRDELNAIYHKNLEYCLWLAPYNVVKDRYNGGSTGGIDGYEESDVILSKLDYDGNLYAYEELPIPVETKMLN